MKVNPEEIKRVCSDNYNAVYRYCLDRLGYDEHKASDATQDVFECFLMKASEVPPEKYRAWLFGVAENKVKEYWRKIAKDDVLQNVDEQAGILSSKEPDVLEQILINKVICQEVDREIIEQLKPHEQQLYRYIYEEDLSLNRVGEKLGENTATIGVRIYRLRQKIKKRVKEKVKNIL